LEKTSGPEHPGTAVGLENLAFVLRGLGDLDGARPLVERALAILEKTRGLDEDDPARTHPM